MTHLLRDLAAVARRRDALRALTAVHAAVVQNAQSSAPAPFARRRRSHPTRAA